MAVVTRAALAAAVALAAGCYDPALRDCTVTCAGAGDCASGQVCGADHFCAAPSVAGTCGKPDARAGEDAPRADAPLIDASTEPDARYDAMPHIDAPPPDAPGALLHIVITGKGKVIDTTGTISCMAPPGDCVFGAEPGQSVTLTAVAQTQQHPFDKWTSANCAGQGASCTLTIVAPVTEVDATFK